MRRVVSVWLPTWATDRIRRQSGAPPEAAPLIAAAREGNTRVVTAVDRAALGLGLRAGMSLAHAQMLVADLTVRDADPAGDAAALVRLAEWCLRYAPLAAADPPDGLWIDVTGSTHLHGGESRMLRDLVRRLAAQGLAARAAVADRPAVAHAIARFGANPVAVVPAETQVMADLPVEALRLPAETVAELRLLGFGRIGPLAVAARAPLTRRFGPILVTRLDQAAGRVFEPIVPVVPAERIQARLSFAEPLLTAEAFAAVIARLTEQVCGDLEHAGLGVRWLDLLFERVDGSITVLRAGAARPVRCARHLGRMLTEKLERLDPGLGVEAMHLIVAATDPLDHTQMVARLTDSDAAPPDIAPLVDRLANRLGEGRVWRVALVESYVPERSVRRVAALSPLTGRSWPVGLPRPVRILHPPQPIEAMALLPDHPPAAFTWRRVRHIVRHADGPERIAGEWWKNEREVFAVRDYFRVEDDAGRRFWLFRRGNGSDAGTGDMNWFLHGFF